MKTPTPVLSESDHIRQALHKKGYAQLTIDYILQHGEIQGRPIVPPPLPTARLKPIWGQITLAYIILASLGLIGILLAIGL